MCLLPSHKKYTFILLRCTIVSRHIGSFSIIYGAFEVSTSDRTAAIPVQVMCLAVLVAVFTGTHSLVGSSATEEESRGARTSLGDEFFKCFEHHKWNAILHCRGTVTGSSEMFNLKPCHINLKLDRWLDAVKIVRKDGTEWYFQTWITKQVRRPTAKGSQNSRGHESRKYDIKWHKGLEMAHRILPNLEVLSWGWWLCQNIVVRALSQVCALKPVHAPKKSSCVLSHCMHITTKLHFSLPIRTNTVSLLLSLCVSTIKCRECAVWNGNIWRHSAAEDKRGAHLQHPAGGSVH